jgi:hypothetical protein
MGEVIDIDSDDSFLDYPPIRYEDGSTPCEGAPMTDWADPEWRRKRGLRPRSEIPSPYPAHPDN